MADPSLAPYYDIEVKPVEDDKSYDELEFNPLANPPKSAKAWLNRIEEVQQAFHDYNMHCDKIDERYAALKELSNLARDREFQMFWANVEVLRQATYARPPVPVVVPKFERTKVYQAAAELLERCAIVAFDIAGIDELMQLIRDDLAILDRGVAWCRYESDGGPNGEECVAIDFKNRRDFLHSLSRNWREVSWVAAASYLTRAQARKRFYKTSGDEYQRAEYRVDKDIQEVGGADARERAQFWEIWDKTTKKVIWVAEGCEDILDEGKPHLKLSGFFPCPKPAYGTTQRASLVPVPDVLQYKDQLEEINLLTGRIHALSEAIEAKGFYPAGGSELADAVQQAVALKTAGRVLVPISNWAMFGGSKEVIVWLPIDMIVTAVQQCVQLRQQIIQDVYQLTGLADIMRGQTSPEETLGAQQIKTQYGSARIRGKQNEIVRIARDLVQIITEIITDKFDDKTIVEMAQTELPTNAQLEEQINQIADGVEQQRQQLAIAMQHPSAQQLAQQDPQAHSQALGQAQQQLQQIEGQAYSQMQKIAEQPTIDQVLRFIKDMKAKAFILDIETDSTIVPDETAEKEQRAEFVTMLAQLMPQLSQMIAADPQTATFCGEVLKFSVAPFRAGRLLEGAIDDLVDLMESKANQPKGPDPTTAQNQTAIQIEQMRMAAKTKADQQKASLAAQKMQLEDKHKQAELENQRTIERMKLSAKGNDAGDGGVAIAEGQQKLQQSREQHQMNMAESAQQMGFEREKHAMQLEQQQRKAQMTEQQAAQKNAMMQFKMVNQPQGPVP